MRNEKETESEFCVRAISLTDHTVDQPLRARKPNARRAENVESPARPRHVFPRCRRAGKKRALFRGKVTSPTRPASSRRASGNTRRATHATTRQRRPLENPPRASLRTPLGAGAFRSVRGRGSGTESRRFGVRGREHPKPRIYISTCSRASPAGRGWTAAAGSANASISGRKSTIATSRAHHQVRRNARMAAAGSTARFRKAFFSRQPVGPSPFSAFD